MTHRVFAIPVDFRLKTYRLLYIKVSRGNDDLGTSFRMYPLVFRPSISELVASCQAAESGRFCLTDDYDDVTKEANCCNHLVASTPQVAALACLLAYLVASTPQVAIT